MKVAHLVRKPISEGSVGRNVLTHGTGGLNIDGSRIRHSSSRDFEGHEARVKLTKNKGGVKPGSWKNSSDLSNVNPVSPAGRWPANLILIHKPGCRLTGTRPAPGYKINQWTDGAKPFGGGAGHPYESVEVPEGVEEVWACVEGCPVRELDGQSLAGGMHPGGHITEKIQPPPGLYEGGWRPILTHHYRDSGGASRFFKQVQAEPAFSRASGQSPCSECGKLYFDHPEDFHALSHDNRPFLHVLCNGSRVKL